MGMGLGMDTNSNAASAPSSASAISNNSSSLGLAFETPLEKRTLLQLVQSILDVAELKTAQAQFQKVMAQDEECAKLLGESLKVQEVETTKPKPKQKQKKSKKKTDKDSAAARPVRRDSKKEN